jgi:hypothetical protein
LKFQLERPLQQVFDGALDMRRRVASHRDIIAGLTIRKCLR